LIEPTPADGTVVPFPSGIKVSDFAEPTERFSLYSLQAAAGSFGGVQEVEIEGWVDLSEVAGVGRIDEESFVSVLSDTSDEDIRVVAEFVSVLAP
jgi:uncharacterized protein YggL (DUF469 family)